MKSYLFKLKVKLQESKTIPCTKPKNVTQGNLKATKQSFHYNDFIESEHYFNTFPVSEKFCTPFSIPLYFSRNPNHSNILVCTDITGEGGTEKTEISYSFGASFRIQWTWCLQLAPSPRTSHLASQTLKPNPWPQYGLALATGAHSNVHSSSLLHQ